MRPRFQSADERRRRDLPIGWLEEELAWHANVTSDAEGRWRITIHQCPFQQISQHQPTVCGVFIRTLIGALYRDVDVQHVPAASGPACCALLVVSAGRETGR